MKNLRLCFVALFAVFLLCSTAQAIAISPFDMYSPYGDNINNTGASLRQLDWAASYGVAKDGNALGPNGNAEPFEFVFQSNLTGFKDVNGQSDVIDGLNDTTIDGTQFEFTIIGSIWEQSTGLGGLGAGFTLANAPVGSANFFEIYADTYDGGVGSGAQSNLDAGSGFYDGTRVMRAEAISGTGFFAVVGDSNNNLVPDNQDQGIGSTQVIWRVTYYDPSFFDFNVALGHTIMSQFDGTLNLPPDPAANGIVMWDGTDPDFFTGNNDGTTPFNTEDLMFNLDGFKIFNIPEPGTMILFGFGLLSLSGVVRRKK